MKYRAMVSFLVISLVLTGLFCADVMAAEQPQREARGRMVRTGGPRLFGDWMLTVEFGETDMEAILSFSRNVEGELTADWISFWGVNELQDVKFEDGKLSFVQVVEFGGNEFRSNFTGSIEEGKLTGTLTSDRGESNVEGVPAPRANRMAGQWKVSYTVGEREMTSTLVLNADAEGELTGEWQSERVQSTISNLNYERGTLTFDRTTTMGERTFESSFEGQIDRQTGELTGTIKSERGEVPVKGTRIGEAVIGTWNLSIEAENGSRRQRLVVYPDLSGLYGTVKIDQVQVDGSQVSFDVTQAFGERTFEMDFAGTVSDSKLTGELTTQRGSQKVTGTKVERQLRRQRPQNQ